MRLKPEKLLALGVFAFAAVVVGYTNILFNTSTRWIVLAIMIAGLMVRGHLFTAFRSPIGTALILMLVWTGLSTIWSEAPGLSTAKAIAFTLVVVTFVSAGIIWAKLAPSERVFNYTIPIALLAVFAALGPGAVVNTYSYGSTTIYRGLSGNPNALGMLCAMGFLGILAWKVPRSSGYRATMVRSMRSALMVALCVIAIWALSRASFIIMALTFVGFAAASGKTKQAWLLFTTIVFISLIALLTPEWIDHLESTVLRKGQGDNASILYSRIAIWEDSLKQAILGSWFGGGYGVTIGDYWPGGLTLTAIGYGREKANSQLAILEELGIVGFIIYAYFIVSLLIIIYASFRRTQDAKLRSNLGIALGAIVGFVVHSVFEAWWVAPGSPEAPFFWGLVGVAVGLSQLERARRRAPKPIQMSSTPSRGYTARSYQ